MRYTIYFRKAVFQHFHINVVGCADLPAAIEAARLAYVQDGSDQQRDIELDGVDSEVEIFSAEQYDNDNSGECVRSWDLNDLSITPGSPIDVER
jgi:hypothetical protein